MSKRAVVVIDLQNEYWPGGGLPLDNIEGAAANAARVCCQTNANSSQFLPRA